MSAINIKLEINGNTTGKLFDSNDIKELGKWVSKNHYLISREELKKEQKLGFDKEPRVRTDNIWEKPEINVLPFGKIEYFSRVDISDAILYAYKMITDRSPKGETGHFISSNYVYYNSKVVAKNAIELETWLSNVELKDKSYIRFVNVMPYASRLEYAGIRKGKRGIIGKRRMSKPRKGGVGVRKPNGVYHLAVGAIRRKYKQAGELIKFDWVGGSSGIPIPSITNRVTGKPFRRTYVKNNPRHSGSYVYPSIVFTISAKGIL